MATKISTEKRGFLPTRKSTILLLSLFVFVPWLLVSVPGVDAGGGGTSGMSAAYYRHGWPFAFLQRATLTFSGTWKNGTYIAGAKPEQSEIDLVIDRMNEEMLRSSGRGLAFDSRTGTARLNSYLGLNSQIHVGFWSVPERWPGIGDYDAVRYQFSWKGLLLNFAVLLMISRVLAWGFERWCDRRSGRLSFSMTEMLVAVCLVGVLLGIIVQESRRSIRENRLLADLIENMPGDRIHYHGCRKNSLPTLVSQLLDHRSRIPLTQTHLFRPVHWLNIDLFDREFLIEDAKGRSRFVEALKKAEFPVFLELTIDRKILPVLAEVTDASAITEATISFYLSPQWDEEEDHGHFEEIALELPNVKKLEVWLDASEYQEKQILPLLDRPNLNEIRIYDLNVEGERFLRSVRQRLPEKTYAQLSEEFDLSRFPKFQAMFEPPPQ